MTYFSVLLCFEANLRAYVISMRLLTLDSTADDKNALVNRHESHDCLSDGTYKALSVLEA